jgi:hypothetical protein
MLDKSARVEALVEPLVAELQLSEADADVARRAAPLASADLGTAMVMEFTNLGGTMGRHYALREGIPEQVLGGAQYCATCDWRRTGWVCLVLQCLGSGASFPRRPTWAGRCRASLQR